MRAPNQGLDRCDLRIGVVDQPSLRRVGTQVQLDRRLSRDHVYRRHDAAGKHLSMGGADEMRRKISATRRKRGLGGPACDDLAISLRELSKWTLGVNQSWQELAG